MTTETIAAPASADDTPYAGDQASEQADTATTEAPAVSLAAQVAHLERQHEERAAQVASARETVAEREAAFLDGSGTPEALAAAQASLQAHEGALAGLSARLAPLRAALQAEQAAERQAAHKAAQRAELEALAGECAAQLAALQTGRAELVRLFDERVLRCGMAKVAATQAQSRFFDALAAYAGADIEAQCRAVRRLEREGVDLDAIATSFGRNETHATRILARRLTDLGFPAYGHFSAVVDSVIGQIIAANPTQG
ncbi:MAG TPA: hypothetical protein VFS08_10430 [Gemmatimonadaceae bacterium]|nr:hypothetical protein [Gemmatimonadaceae bacterium]